MSASSFDPARKHTFYFRCSRDGSKTISFIDAAGLAKDVSDYEFTYQIKQKPQYSDNVIELTNSDIIRPSISRIRLDVTVSITSVPPLEYYGQLNVVTPAGKNKTWLTGPNIFHNGEFDGITETNELTIYEEGESIVIQISESGTSTIRTYSTTTLTTLTPDVINYDLFELTAQGSALTIANPSTDLNTNDPVFFRITDNGTGRALTFGSKYRAFGSALPTTTTANKTLYLSVIRNTTDDKYDVLPSIEEV